MSKAFVTLDMFGSVDGVNLHMFYNAGILLDDGTCFAATNIVPVVSSDTLSSIRSKVIADVKLASGDADITVVFLDDRGIL